MSSRSVEWICKPFAELSPYELHAALALRCRVFIVEQGPYQDPDAGDLSSWHLLGHGADGALLATLRVMAPGVSYPEPSLGRVVCAPEARGTGLGRELVARGLAHCQALYPDQDVRISAQAHLTRFYGEFGFVTVSDVYLEDEIPHVEMLFSAAGVNA